jgi:hypothetical protein
MAMTDEEMLQIASALIEKVHSGKP